jgi:hypothetical protein
MASDDADSEDLAEGTHEPRECMACRGTGRVISNLGDSPSTVSCPWCGGNGLRAVDLDAQAHWGEADRPADAEQAEQAAAEQPPISQD